MHKEVHEMEKKEEKKKPSGSFSEVWDKRGQETDAANDFRKKIEMEITEARRAMQLEIVLKPWHMNILGIVHGGVLYSLADTVGGTAAMTGRDYAVPTVDGTIHYLKAGKTHPKSSPGRRKYRMVMHFRCANARFMMIRRRCWHRQR